jgi:site-specific recombinase XerD
MTTSYSLLQAENLTGISRQKLRRWCESGQIAGQLTLKGRERPTWKLSLLVIDSLKSQKFAIDYETLVEQWVNEQNSGFHSGKPLNAKTSRLNLTGLENFWKYFGEAPSVDRLNAENLRRAIFNIPVDHAAKNCHFSKREHMFKAVCSFFKLLVRQGLKLESEIEQIRREKPRHRTYQPNRPVLQSEDKLLHLLEVNESWLSGRSDFDRELTRTIFMILAFTGLRKSELIDLELIHLDLQDGILSVIDGKGGKHRQVGIYPEAEQQIRRWLDHYRPHSSYPNFLLQEDGQPLTGSVIQGRIQRLRKASGIYIPRMGYAVHLPP